MMKCMNMNIIIDIDIEKMKGRVSYIQESYHSMYVV